jgi:hypothetical protein
MEFSEKSKPQSYTSKNSITLNKQNLSIKKSVEEILKWYAEVDTNSVNRMRQELPPNWSITGEAARLCRMNEGSLPSSKHWIWLMEAHNAY